MKKILAALLSLAMTLSMLPGMALAATDGGSSGETTSSGVDLNKTATLEDDGTYTINLEAYATGEVKTTTTTTTTGVPCDIVLVLDQSGSMAKDFNGGTADSITDKRITALKNAATAFVGSVQANAAAYNVDHKVAIVGFACDNSSNYQNTELLSTQNAVGYKKITKTDYQNALVSANSDDAVNPRLTTAIDRVAAEGSTYANYGLKMAKGVLDQRTETTYTKPDGTSAERKTIVVFFTDGYPGYTAASNGNFYESNQYDNISTANETIAQAAALKKSGATIYSVGIFSGADPASSYNFTQQSNYSSTQYTPGTQAANAYMHFVSSDYDSSCTSMTSSDRTNVVNNGYYLAASDASALSKVFETISSSIDSSSSSTTSTLDADSILRDVMADGFDADNATVTVQTADYQGNGVWAAPVEFTAATVTQEDGAVDVKGFNYKENYVAEAGATSSVTGKKLIVTIKGVVPTDGAVTNTQVDTNAATSGIYATASDETPAAVFPQPKTILTSKSYVLDYAKAFTMDAADWKQTTTALYGSFSKIAAAPQYGNLNDLTYTPKTTNWNGYDSFYAFGKTTDTTVTAASANANGNLWSKVNVIPANNVYYEDDFMTSTTSGTVGIVYTGEWTTDGAPSGSGNTETANGEVHGWEESLSDDTTYSDGSAHVSSTSGATASFSFTGTGVDIYSRTNDKTGTIYVTVKSSNGSTTTTKRTAVDNKARSGDYYQIPTYTFKGEYGTYDVTVRVTTGAASENRYTYYLDGIRVYNPISNEDEDAAVQDAYGEEEVQAVFTEVRSLMNEGSGTAFIDEDENGDPVNKNYADAEVAELAPEHEVYLASGQSVVIAVDGNSGNAYYLGLKAPAGTTSVAFSNDDNASTASISHASDLYYKVVPSNGMIVVKNTGDKLLSITKLRTAGSGEAGISSLSDEEALNAAAAFSAARSVSYNAEPATDEELTEQEQPEETEPEAPAEEETPAEEPGEVIIENPEEPEPSEEQEEDNSASKWVNNLFSGLKGLFGRH